MNVVDYITVETPAVGRSVTHTRLCFDSKLSIEGEISCRLGGF